MSIRGARISDASVLGLMVAMDFVELLLATAELGGSGILDAAGLYMLVACASRSCCKTAGLGCAGNLHAAMLYMLVILNLAELLFAVAALISVGM